MRLLTLIALLAMPVTVESSDDDIRVAIASFQYLHVQHVEPKLTPVLPRVQAAPLQPAPVQIRLPFAQPTVVNDGRHAHTCSSCGATWWHKHGDPGFSHDCPRCGRHQTTIDRNAVRTVTPSYVAPAVRYGPQIVSEGKLLPTTQIAPTHVLGVQGPIVTYSQIQPNVYHIPTVETPAGISRPLRMIRQCEGGRCRLVPD